MTGAHGDIDAWIGRLPILVGVTGKRSFARDPQEDDRLAAVAAERLRAFFDRLDRRFPHAPKVLLTGAAYGADTIAAQAARERASWSVVLVLPFEADVFRKDFRADPADGVEGAARAKRRLAAFDALLEEASAPPDSRRVMLRVLPLLDGPDGQPVRALRLDRDGENDRALRHAHYEQVGQFIAEAAMVMVAVLSGPKSQQQVKADGGTTRVIACRRAGRPDDAGAEVARRSRILRNHWDSLHAPPAGHVWLIDVHELARQADILVPLAEHDVDEVYKDCLAHPLGAGLEEERPTPRQARAAGLATTRALNGYEKVRAREPGPHASATTPVLRPVADPVAHLAAVRRSMRPVNTRMATLKNGAFMVVAGLFVAALLALEMFNELMPEDVWPIGAYTLFLVGAMAVVYVAGRWRWQERHEDYRAVSEMLRVQRAWWAAGLAERVDRFHLQGVAADLAHIRDAGRALLHWVWLRSAWPDARPPGVSADLVRPAGHAARATDAIRHNKRPPPDWIGEQIWYFAKNQPTREKRAATMDAATWLLFAVSAAMAVAVLCWIGLEEQRPGAVDILTMLQDATMPGAIAVAGLLACAVLLWGRLRFARYRRLLLVAVLAIAAALCFSGAIMDGASFTDAFRDAEHPLRRAIVVRDIGVVVFVGLTAIAGALHFLNEKLGHEAEAQAYREALDHFERAERALAGLAPEAEEYRAIVRDLGKLALRENEEWLKAHRERPLNPVVG